ncbi:MAG: hypothetical protein KKH94_02660 [Candidatus Omnitrophica bacterium]|nr:hypothetical protein [Candidatus Omnitrophota bacterium]
MDKIEIKKDKLLLVEGNDDQNFFQKLIQEIALDSIQIISMNGKENFRAPNLKSVINTPGFKEVKSLGIIRDADENAENTFNSICAVLKECGLPEPTQPMEITNTSLKVGILIIPPSTEKGQIEDLCLSSLKDYSEMRCIDNYFKCLKKKLPSNKFPKELSKAKIQAFLASREESVPHLGIAAQRSYFPLSNDVFGGIKKFLRSL